MPNSLPVAPPSSLSSRLLALSLVAFALVALGCASVLSKTHQRVQLQSDVEGTQVTVEEGGSNVVYGPQYAPAWVVLDKSKDYVVRFEAPDGRVLELEPGRSFDPVTLINILGLLGFIADLYTGAFFRYEADAWRADFEQGQVSQTLPDRALPRLELPAYTPQGSATRRAQDEPDATTDDD